MFGSFVRDSKIRYVADIDGTRMIRAGEYREPGQIVFQK